MGARGPKKTPTALRIAYSQPAKNGAARDQVEASPVAAAPPCPSWLRGYARDRWRHHVREMMAVSMLSDLDLDLLAAYCETVRAHRECCEIEAELARLDPSTRGLVVRNGSGGVRLNPIVAAKSAAARDMVRMAQALGLSPSARASISLGDRGGMAGSKPDEWARKFGL